MVTNVTNAGRMHGGSDFAMSFGADGGLADGVVSHQCVCVCSVQVEAMTLKMETDARRAR